MAEAADGTMILSESWAAAHWAIGFARQYRKSSAQLEKAESLSARIRAGPQVFIAHVGNEAMLEAAKLASNVRKDGAAAIMATGDRSLKAQLRQADSLGSNYAAIIGEDEVKSGTVTLRNMKTGEQKTVSPAALGWLVKVKEAD